MILNRLENTSYKRNYVFQFMFISRFMSTRSNSGPIKGHNIKIMRRWDDIFYLKATYDENESYGYLTSFWT